MRKSDPEAAACVCVCVCVCLHECAAGRSVVLSLCVSLCVEVSSFLPPSLPLPLSLSLSLSLHHCFLCVSHHNADVVTPQRANCSLVETSQSCRGSEAELAIGGSKQTQTHVNVTERTRVCNRLHSELSCLHFEMFACLYPFGHVEGCSNSLHVKS